MGGLQSFTTPRTENLGDITSNAENDYNPYGIETFDLEKPSDFNPVIAARGSPPVHTFKKCDFARLPIEKQAAYADGVVRGSYKREWIRNQSSSLNDDANSSSVGAIAYIYLKTNTEEYGISLKDWCDRNAADERTF